MTCCVFLSFSHAVCGKTKPPFGDWSRHQQTCQPEAQCILHLLIPGTVTQTEMYLLCNSYTKIWPCHSCLSCLPSKLLFLSPLQGMYFDRDDVALPKFSTFFLERSVKEREQAEKLLGYQNMRGGRILLQTIAVCSWNNDGVILK